MAIIDVKVPDIGDFSDVPVVSVLVSVGDTVAQEDGLVELESDKATLEVPSPVSGTVVALTVSEGDNVSEGTPILSIETEADAIAESPSPSVSGTGAATTAEPPGYGSAAGVHETIDIRVPDIGDFSDVPVVSVLVAAGDDIQSEDPLIEIESDKATMEVPAPQAGKVLEVIVAEGDSVSEGSLILKLTTADAQAISSSTAATPAPSVAATSNEKGDIHAEVLVLGSGPGGYTAAFRAADLNMKTVLVERHSSLGGVCLNVGCIPSKALLHAAKVMTEAEEMSHFGVKSSEMSVDVDELRQWKDSVVGKLTGGLKGLAKARKVEVVNGTGQFASPHLMRVTTPEGEKTISFDQCIVAVGSEPVKLPFIPHDDPRVIDSTGALELHDIPEKLLILGGGIIGLEMACVYDAFGSNITVVELMDQIIPGADKDIVKPLHQRIKKRYENIFLKTKVTAIEPLSEGLKVTFEDDKGTRSDIFDKVLVAVGRRPNGHLVGLENAGVSVDERGFISTDNQMRTEQAHIFAIGDVVGQPMLAHKAVHEGKVAAEAASGLKRAFDARVIPSVAYTDPEVAWVGLTENEAKAKGIKVGKGVFPWAASGRSLSLGRDEGITKLLFDETTHQVLGAGIVGPNAGDLVAEAAVAIEMGCDATDLGHTIHPHPTLSETVNFAAEMYEGTITDLMPPKKRK